MSSLRYIDNESPPRPTLSTPAKRKFLDLQNHGLTLLLWDFLLGVPISYLFTSLNRAVVQYLGYEKIMRCPSGIWFSRLLFVVVNMAIVISWAVQLAEEERKERKLRLWLEIEKWDREIERLEGLLKEKIVEREGRGVKEVEGWVMNL